MMAFDEFLFSDRDRLDAALAEHIGRLLRKAVEMRGTATLVVSGGNTPRSMLARLSLEELDWSRVTVMLADERWVPTENDRSNEKMVRSVLLQNNAAQAGFVGLYRPDIVIEEAPVSLENDLDKLKGGADVLVLGMGEDGHTASLFPCAANIQQLVDEKSNDKVVVVVPKTAPDMRISLAFPVLINARNVFLHITGEMKKELLGKIIAGQKTAPVGAVIGNAKGHVQIYWAA